MEYVISNWRNFRVKGKDNYLPHLLGHEGCGTICKLVLGVKYVSPEDLVVLHWRKGIGIESETPKYLWNNSKLNAGWVTTFNTHAIIRKENSAALKFLKIQIMMLQH